MTDLAPDRSRLARGVAVSTGSQLAAKALHLVLNVVSTLAIIRYLAPADYGAYVLVLTTTLLVGLVADFGLSKLAVREIARDGEAEHEILGTVIASRLLLAVVAVGITQLLLTLLGAGADAHLAALVASSIYFSDAVLSVVVVAFHVRVAQHYEAAIRVGMELFETAFVLWLVARGASLPLLFVPPALATVLGAAIAVVVARRSFQVRFRVAPGRVGHLAREALPIGPALVIGVIYLKLDGLLLAVLATSREVGLYGSAYQPIEYAFLASAVVIGVVFPLLSRAFGEGDTERFAAIYRHSTEVLVGLMVLVPLVLVFTAEPLLTLLYGADYAAAAAPLRVLSVALVLMVVNGWQAFVLLAGGHQRTTLHYNLAALVLSAALGVVCISRFGMIGASFAALGTAVFVLVVSNVAVRRLLGVRLHTGTLVRVLAAAAVAVGVQAFASRAGLAWIGFVPLAVAVYGLALLATGAVQPDRLPSWRAALAGGGVGDAPLADAGAIDGAIDAPVEPGVIDLREPAPGVVGAPTPAAEATDEVPASVPVTVPVPAEVAP